MNRSRRTAGTSLVEILVVIVIILIGILAIIQIFPGGFRLLGLTRSQSVANGLVRKEIERLKSHADQIPDRVVPVRYVRSNGELVAIVDSNRRTNDLGPTADGLTQLGHFTLAGDDLGPWRRATAANMVTRVVGESTIIPAPRPAAGAISGQLYYGGLMTLQFGPAVFNPEVAGNSTDSDVIFNVYANDLSLALGVPDLTSAQPFREYLYYCDQPDQPGATLYVPQAASPIRYRLAMTAYVRDAANNVRPIEVLDYILTIPAGAPSTYSTVSLATIVNGLPSPPLNAGESFIGVSFDSLQLAPLFERIPKGSNFGSGNPYEYKLIDDINTAATNVNLGVLLFNPAGYKYYVPNSEGRRIPLTARVNYNVYDWGIIREDFRVPSSEAESTRLALSSLKSRNNIDTDGLTYQGLGFLIPNGAGGTQQLDVVIQDMETGGIYAYDPTSAATLNNPNLTAYRVDKSIGSVRFQDQNTATPELELTLYRPDTWAPIQVPDARGRAVRVYYQSSQEYQLQVLKAASRYIGVNGIPGSGQASLGNLADPLQRTKIYFSNSELGRSVSIAEAYVLWDVDGPGPGGATEVRKVSVSGPIKAPNALDPVQLPYMDLADAFGAGWAVSWSAVDETGKSPGYIVRGVRGSSVSVRVLWNPQKFSLGSDALANMTAYDRWAANWRRSTTETFLQKGGTQ